MPELYSEKIFYLAGLVAGDSYLEPNRNRIDIRAKSRKFLNGLQKLLKEYGPTLDYKNQRIRITSKKLCGQLVKDFKISKGKKSKVVEVPLIVKQSTRKCKFAYLAGWYDAEGWIEKDKRYSPSYKRVRFCITSKKAANAISKILSKLGFRVNFFNSKTRFCIDLNGKNNVDKFFRLIPIQHIKWINASAH